MNFYNKYIKDTFELYSYNESNPNKIGNRVPIDESNIAWPSDKGRF